MYPIWFGRLASQLKRRYLGVQRVNGETVAPGRKGKVLVYDRVGDFLIGVAALVASLEILSLETGVAFTSLIALSGAGAVVIALACQEPLGHVINGLLLTFNDKFRPGCARRPTTRHAVGRHTPAQARRSCSATWQGS